MKILKRYIIVFCLTMLVAICCILYFGRNNNANALVGIVDDSTIKSVYSFGDNIEINQVTIKYNDKNILSEGSYVIYPNGNSVDSTNIILTQAGEYKIVYFAQQDNNKVYAYKTFKVTSNMYDVTSSKSSAEYKKPTDYETNGIVVKLAEGDEFKYNQVLDISNYLKGNSILGFYAIPESYGMADCKDVIIKLTDAYDSTNYVELKVSNASYMGSWADVAVYLKGSSCGQTFVGTYTNNLGESWTRNDWAGTLSYFTLTGKQNHTVHTDLDGNIFNFYMDYDERKIYTDDCLGVSGLVIDLSDKNSFPKPWDGFTTGECFLSVRGENYQATSLNLVITNIDNRDLTNNVLEINNKIIIDVDTQGYEEIPFAKVNKPYCIFNSDARSVYQDNLIVEKSVYYSYGTSKQLNISLEDNSFIPKKEGIYTIEYLVRDNYGNIETKTIDVLAKNVEDLEIESSQLSNSCIIGTKYDSITISNIKNVSGNYSLYGEVYKDGGKYCALNDDLSFIPEHEGNYTIKIICEDFIEKTEVEYSVCVNKKNISKIIGESSLPKYFIKNAKYVLDNLLSKDYSSGKPIESMSDIYVKEDDNTQVKLTSNEYIVKANNFVNIEYRTKDSADIKSYTIPVIDVGYGSSIDIKKYFVKSNNNLSLTYEDGYLAMQTADSGFVEFINKVMVTDFQILLKTNKSTCNYDKINIYFEDCLNRKQVKFSVISENGYITLMTNDGDDRRTIQGSFVSNDGFEVNLKYDSAKNLATIDNENYISINNYLDGSDFNGFTNNRVFLRVEIENVSKVSTLEIKKINNQTFTDQINSDITKPQYCVNTIYGDRIVGEKFVIKGVDFCDVLDPYTNSSMKITSYDEDFIETIYTSDDGVVFDGKQDYTIDYEISFSKIGDYTLTYIAKDGVGCTTKYSYVISVIDNIAPTITLTNIITTAKVNENYSIAKYSVSDDISDPKDIILKIYVMDTKNIFTELNENNYKFTEKGTYKIVYLAFDEEGNETIEKYSVVVEG